MEMLIFEKCHFDFSRFSSRLFIDHLPKIMYVNPYLLGVNITFQILATFMKICVICCLNYHLKNNISFYLGLQALK